ncbi:MAG TPA: hypothetical protein VFQ85_10760 [Mycobacteriales bacterium]|jgi:hypothetical protein|nr:hypothetical protein [Mycobacteriales bacterium]
MREFTDAGQAGPDTAPVETVEHSGYLEVRLRETPRPLTRSVYVLNAGEGVGAAVTCWGQRFDPVFAGFDDPKYGRIWMDAYRTIWPTLFALIDNAIDERFGDGALTELVDPDDVNRKWFVAVLFSTSSGEAAAEHAVDRVAELSVALSNDLTRQLGWKEKAKIAARGGRVGYREGREIADRWEKRLDWLRPLLGG